MMYVGFSTSGSLVSRLIRWLTRSDVSHAFLLIDDALFGQPMVMEAIDSGVSLVTLKTFRKTNQIVTVLQPPVTLESSVRRAADWLGEHYAFEGLFGMLVVQAGWWLRRHWYNPIHQSKALFCSELVTFVAQDAGWPGTMCLDGFSTNPAALRACLQKTSTTLPLSEFP